MLQNGKIDYDAIGKGAVIPAEEVERLFNCDRDDKHFPLHLMSLQSTLERELNARGKGVTVRVSGGQILVLTDSEALPYNSKSFRHGMARARKAHDRLLMIDRQHLSSEECKTHEREVLITGKTIQAAMSAYKGIEAEPHKRTTPGISG